MNARIEKRGRRFYVTAELGSDPATGQRRRTVRSAGTTREEARAKLREVLVELERGTLASRAHLTVASYLVGDWLPSLGGLRPSTVAQHQINVTAYICPRIGELRLQGLRSAHLAKLYADLSESGGRRGGPLAPKTVKNVHSTLHKALAYAVHPLG